MPDSLSSSEVEATITQARSAAGTAGGPTPSPADWRDKWIYFLMVDRFNNRLAAPRHSPFDDPTFADFQGGTFRGITAQLSYLKQLGVGALWLSPVLANFRPNYHGYGIHDFISAEPRFAENPADADAELRELVDAAHAEGLYVIFDIVLNHVGDVFAYRCDPQDTSCLTSDGAQARFSTATQPVGWRDRAGNPDPSLTPIEDIVGPSRDAYVWPRELHHNAFFRRQGTPQPGGDDTVGDFQSLKQMRTDDLQLQDLLIKAYQYVIARFDVDGFRIDTLRYLKGDLPRLFGNAVREFALSIGKENFFTYGEVFDGHAEQDIARFIGRNTRDASELVGVDAALDYPLFDQLKPISKGFAAPTGLAGMFQLRKQLERDVLSSHGDATRFFVTFLDNHDVKERIRFVQSGDEHRFDDQVSLGLACLGALPGIPCLYYGTEQGLSGRGATKRSARRCGAPGFDRASTFYLASQQVLRVRAAHAALRYGRTYLRPLSGHGDTFGLSPFHPGVLAFSRILADEEVLVVANTDIQHPIAVDVIVDLTLTPVATKLQIAYSNKPSSTPPDPTRRIDQAQVNEPDGGTGTGPLNAVHVTLQPMEVQILSRR